jgi:hypothetical protein
VLDFLDGGRWSLVAAFEEHETGRDNDRPKLREAMALCRVRNATLVIARIDRLSRNTHFLLGLQEAKVRFVAADMPDANELTVGIMAVIAQAESKRISANTKAAMAAAWARGRKLGHGPISRRWRAPRTAPWHWRQRSGQSPALDSGFSLVSAHKRGFPGRAITGSRCATVPTASKGRQFPASVTE